MQVKSKSGRAFELPSDEEDTAINAGIATDPDTYELSDDEFKRLRRAGRPKAVVTKERITIRLSPENLKYFRAKGRGWQTRIDEALAEYRSKHEAL